MIRSRFWFVALILFLSCSTTTFAEQPTGPQRDDPRQKLIANTLKGKLLEVHFVDVGQGDAIFIRTPGGKDYLIDTGPRGARRTLIPYLRYLKVKKLEAVLLTHSHMDHVGALYYIADEFEIGTVYSSGYFHPSKHNAKTLTRLEEKGIKLKTLKRGNRVELDKEIILKAVHPPAEWEPFNSDLNDYSVATRLTYGDIDFLLVGDAERKAEKSMLKGKVVLRSEFLKVGHHGSSTASTDDFLDAVSPFFAVIQCGVNNKFKHPHADVVQRLKDRDITIMRTDENGTIGVYTDGKRIMIKIKGKPTEEPVSLLIHSRKRGGLSMFVHNRGGVHVS